MTGDNGNAKKPAPAKTARASSKGQRSTKASKAAIAKVDDAAVTPPKPKIGRPRKIIKQDEFEKLCGLQCTQEEICGWFGVHSDTLTKWCKETYEGRTFSEAFKVYSQDGKISLRRHQFRLAEKSAAMAIFLGKNILGQRDNWPEEREAGVVAEAGAALVINYNYAGPKKDEELSKETKP